MNKEEQKGWILGILDAVNTCLRAGEETIALEILKDSEIKREEAVDSDFCEFESMDNYIKEMKASLPKWNENNEKSALEPEESIKETEIKTINNGWVRLESYCDGYVIGIKEFHGICVLVSNFSAHSIHDYSISDIENDEGDWNYICSEKLLEILEGDDALEEALPKYHLTDEEIHEVLNFDFDDISHADYKRQVKRVEEYLKNNKD
ncbi:hypothetical protein IA807_13920 [Listeria seeligeri]|uniref:hypothetical protein n=1 Tax=Listeria seeligeri TaxID=1640 RepID=UPI0018894D47|nr:hypothetical protein [Listeria seeligeri]MBF2356011.1 hypothetical protein [Listeria seeligeri]